jgi:hypothetical protein
MLLRPSVKYACRVQDDPYGRWAVAAIGLVMLCQFAFLVIGCDWDLCNDEAEFWAWSRRLDWSYYARGPLIAWLIRLSTELLGWLSIKLTGSLMLAVRLPAVLLGGLTAWGVFRLASLTVGARRAALMSVLLMPAIPIFAIGGVLITCDTPLVCCWTWAAVWSYRAIMSDDTQCWIVAGVTGVLGVWAKYSFLAFPASVGLFLLLSPAHRRQLPRPGFWAMALICAVVGLAPIVVWNAHHGWAGAGQLADRVGLSSRATWGGIQPVLRFLGGEFAVLGGVWWVAGVAAIAGALARAAKHRPSVPSADTHDAVAGGRSGAIYLLCLWGVIWTACFAASLLGETEANWMVPGYIAVVILIGMRIDRATAQRGARRLIFVTAWLLSLAFACAIHHVEWCYPIVARYLPAPTPRWPVPLRLYEPTARLRGHRMLARAVQAQVEALEKKGESPFVLTPTYALTSTLSFYLTGQPETYCLSWNYGMTRHPVNQHDLWHPNPRHDPEPFRARAAVVVEDANMPPNVANHMIRKGVFGRLDSTERVTVLERGVIVGAWDISVCHDYRGIAGYKQSPLVR